MGLLLFRSYADMLLRYRECLSRRQDLTADFRLNVVFFFFKNHMKTTKLQKTGSPFSPVCFVMKRASSRRVCKTQTDGQALCKCLIKGYKPLDLVFKALGSLARSH